MVLLVVDASVILKWFFKTPEEKDRNKAIELRDQHILGKLSLCVPQYSIYEIANALSFSTYKLSREVVV